MMLWALLTTSMLAEISKGGLVFVIFFDGLSFAISLIIAMMIRARISITRFRSNRIHAETRIRVLRVSAVNSSYLYDLFPSEGLAIDSRIVVSAWMFRSL